ncbi:MAG TPA: hypothetical protein VGA67_02075 [Candidatus Dojkabacteria bacterium]|jgi:hypothetical protein
MKFKIKRKTILSIFLILSLLLMLSIPSAVMAQDECEGVSIGDENSPLGVVCFNTLSNPFAGIAKGGIFSALAQVLNYFVLFVGVMWIINLGLILWDYFSAGGADQEKIKTAGMSTTNIFRGISFVLLGFVVVYIVGIIGGLGSPFNWADQLYQCGQTDEKRNVYMNYIEELEALTTSSGTIDVYCCFSENEAFDGWFDGLPAGADPKDCELFKENQQIN